MAMEPKYLAEEVIVHPNYYLTFGDWIPRQIVKQLGGRKDNKKIQVTVGFFQDLGLGERKTWEEESEEAI